VVRPRLATGPGASSRASTDRRISDLKRSLLLALLLAGTLASRARADGINLAWNNCLASSQAVSDLKFSCDDDSRSFSVIGSFIPPGGINHLTANEYLIEVMSDRNDLPDWWRMDEAGCRAGSLGSQASFAGMMGCGNYWGNAVAGGVILEPSLDRAGRWRLRGVQAKSQILAGPVSPGKEYYAFQVIIDSQKSSGACGGCSDGVCLVLTSIKLTQPVGEGDYTLTNPATRACVTWQGGAASCPTACRQQTRRVTWGQVKNLYR